jgi:hypothetical protein
VAKELSVVKGTTVENILDRTTSNVELFFGLTASEISHISIKYAYNI